MNLDFKGITDDSHDNLLKEYKGKQSEILAKMQNHSDADKDFYITAKITLNLAKRAKEIFESSKPEEKRQLLSFLLQNLSLDGKKLSFTIRSPFKEAMDYRDNLIGLPLLDEFRTLNWVKIKRELQEYVIFANLLPASS